MDEPKTYTLVKEHSEQSLGITPASGLVFGFFVIAGALVGGMLPESISGLPVIIGLGFGMYVILRMNGTDLTKYLKKKGSE